MKKIILIILALTLLVVSCAKDDENGNGITSSGNSNTPEAKAWKNNVAGKIFINTYGDEIKFNSNGVFDQEKYSGKFEEDGIEYTYSYTSTYSIAKGISANQVIIKEHSVGMDKEYFNETRYTGYELDSTGLLLYVGYGNDTIASVNWDKKRIEAFAKGELEQELTADNWLPVTEVPVGSIFINETAFDVKREWDYNEAKQTNTVTTFGYLRVGDLGKMDGGVQQDSHDNQEPKNSTKSATLDRAKIGSIAGDYGTLITDQSYSYKNDNLYIYALCFENNYAEKKEYEYKIYSFEYNSVATPKEIKFLGSSDSRLSEMPKDTILQLSSEKVQTIN